MCRTSTRVLRSAALGVSLGLFFWGSALFAQSESGWRPLGGLSVAEGLAGPAGGPVAEAWFSPSGDRLFVRTASGRIFETVDAGATGRIDWKLNTTDAPRATAVAGAPATSPEPRAHTAVAAGRLFAAGSSHVFASDDGGLTWVALASANGRSLLGENFTSLAVSPANPQEIVATSNTGVWRSADGGLSWRGLNDGLPNLPVRKLIDRFAILLADGNTAELTAGAWVVSSTTDPENTLRSRFSATTGAQITAAAQTSALAWAGTANGLLLASRDGGASWPDAHRLSTSAPVSRIWVDSTQPELALAAAGGRLFRTINGGGLWDDVSGSLPDSNIHGIAADPVSNHVWVATDRGVFEARLALNSASLASPEWRSAGAGLPTAAAWDVRLNKDNTLEIALDGYGVFETEQPQRTGVHIVNGADLSDRAAAPGSLVSVIGASVTSARNGNVSWPVLAALPASSQLQVPFETPAGAVSLAIEAAGSSFMAPVRVKDVSPAIFVDGDGAPLLLDAASGLVLDPKSPVRPGSVVQIMATGLGRVNPDWPTGIPAPADSPPSVRGSVTAFLDGAPIEVTRATLAPGYVGYYVIDLKIPLNVSPGIRELRVLVNGEQSNSVKMFLDNTRQE